jgi:hypothetical protein
MGAKPGGHARRTPGPARSDRAPAGHRGGQTLLTSVLDTFLAVLLGRAASPAFDYDQLISVVKIVMQPRRLFVKIATMMMAAFLKAHGLGLLTPACARILARSLLAALDFLLGPNQRHTRLIRILDWFEMALYVEDDQIEDSPVFRSKVADRLAGWMNQTPYRPSPPSPPPSGDPGESRHTPPPPPDSPPRPPSPPAPPRGAATLGSATERPSPEPPPLTRLGSPPQPPPQGSPPPGATFPDATQEQRTESPTVTGGPRTSRTAAGRRLPYPRRATSRPHGTCGETVRAPLLRRARNRPTRRPPGPPSLDASAVLTPSLPTGQPWPRPPRAIPAAISSPSAAARLDIPVLPPSAVTGRKDTPRIAEGHGPAGPPDRQPSPTVTPVETRGPAAPGRVRLRRNANLPQLPSPARQSDASRQAREQYDGRRIGADDLTQLAPDPPDQPQPPSLAPPSSPGDHSPAQLAPHTYRVRSPGAPGG